MIKKIRYGDQSYLIRFDLKQIPCPCFHIRGVSNSQKSMISQTACPSHAGLVARLRSIRPLCAIAEGFEAIFRGFTNYQHSWNSMGLDRSEIDLMTLRLGSAHNHYAQTRSPDKV